MEVLAHLSTGVRWVSWLHYCGTQIRCCAAGLGRSAPLLSLCKRSKINKTYFPMAVAQSVYALILFCFFLNFSAALSQPCVTSVPTRPSSRAPPPNHPHGNTLSLCCFQLTLCPKEALADCQDPGFVCVLHCIQSVFCNLGPKITRKRETSYRGVFLFRQSDRSR